MFNLTMSCFKNKNMFAFNMEYFFRIWAKTRQTFSKFTDDVIFFWQSLNVRRVLA